MTKHFLSLGEIANRLGLQDSRSLSSYTMPEPGASAGTLTVIWEEYDCTGNHLCMEEFTPWTELREIADGEWPVRGGHLRTALEVEE